MLNVKKLSTPIYEDIIITNLTGYISITDVNTWFNSFEKTCYSFISQEKKYKLLVNRKGYIPEHESAYEDRIAKFFSNNILENIIAVACLLEEGDILSHLEHANTKDNVIFSSNYDQLIDWLSDYR